MQDFLLLQRTKLTYSNL